MKIYDVNFIISPILQLGPLRLGEVKQFILDHLFRDKEAGISVSQFKSIGFS